MRGAVATERVNGEPFAPHGSEQAEIVRAVGQHGKQLQSARDAAHRHLRDPPIEQVDEEVVLGAVEPTRLTEVAIERPFLDEPRERDLVEHRRLRRDGIVVIRQGFDEVSRCDRQAEPESRSEGLARRRGEDDHVGAIPWSAATGLRSKRYSSDRKSVV